MELKIFEKEIDQVLLSQKNALTLQNKAEIANQYSPEIMEMNNEIAQLKNEISNKENDVNALYETYIAEAEGRKGTQLLGKGPVYKEKREKHDAALTDLNKLQNTNTNKINDLQSKIGILQTQQNAKVQDTQPVIDNFDGLMARINALGSLPWLPSFFIFLLFLVIECAPILAKLLSPKGVYDLKLEDEEDIVKNWVAQNKYQRKTMLAADREITDQVYGDLKSEESLYSNKKKIAQSLMEAQAEAFYVRQRRIL